MKADFYYNNVILGAESYFLSHLCASQNDHLLYIGKSNAQLRQMSYEIGFYNNNIEVIHVVSEDISPFELISPGKHLAVDKISSLHKLLVNNKKAIILITPDVLLQKIISRENLQKYSLKIIPGQAIDREQLFDLLTISGYERVDIATGPAQFSVRGGIIDIVHSLDHAYRIDFFGSQVETIKLFNTFDQMSVKKLNEIVILPANQVILDDDFIQYFKEQYKKIELYNEQLYQSVANHQFYEGVESFIGIFYNKLDSIFDYLPKSLKIISDFSNEDEFNRYLCQINSPSEELLHYSNYLSCLRSSWLNQIELDDYLSNYNLSYLSNIKLDIKNGCQSDFKYIPNIELNPNVDNSRIVQVIKTLRDTNKNRLVISCVNQETFDRLKQCLLEANIHVCKMESWQEHTSLSIKTVGMILSNLKAGFSTTDFTLLTEHDLFGKRSQKKQNITKRFYNILNENAVFEKGEYVVHANFGIGQFEGLQTIEVLGVKRDFILILYADNDKLYLPVENIELISKYGNTEHGIKLDKLGSFQWQERKSRIQKKIKEIADELIKIAAKRQMQSADIFIPLQEKYKTFCDNFQFVTTEDQDRAIIEIEDDLSSGKASDRLICGDVGFGKTEIAVRAAFIVTNNEDLISSQVAVIVPTTLLAKQHYETFKRRFQGFDTRIKLLSRMTSKKDATLVKKAISEGEVDIVIGTHALLSKDINFKNLNMLIIDEEQHFGVAQKEQLKKLKSNIHLLTLSATPIPRTLQMSLSGIRDLSLIATPPVERLPIKTFLIFYDKQIIRDAILREYHRGGQCFFVAPRVGDLDDIKKFLDELVPEVKNVIAHGQMTAVQLDKIMQDFIDGKYAILIATTIIESGLDVPGVNTIFIHRPEMFGVSSLYQLRGRVGRGNLAAHAYFLLSKKNRISDLARKRLELIQSLDHLGAGFTIASHDMDIRGFGNILGDEQSGHVKEVGIELYQSMLQECIESLKNEEVYHDNNWSPQLNLGISVLIPADYIADVNLRMSLYRKIANLQSGEEVESFKSEMLDRFGKFPLDVEHLMLIVQLKIQAKKLNIEKIDATEKGVLIAFRNNLFSNVDALLNLVKNRPDIKLRADQKIFFLRHHSDQMKAISFVFEILSLLKNL